MATQTPAQAATVGVEDVDGEHEVQVRLLSAFLDAAGDGRTPAELDEILDRLIDYSKMHFMSEELLMRLYGYGDYEAHVLEHERTVEGIEALRAQHAAGEVTVSRERAEELGQWIVRHIATSDRRLGHFLAETRSGRV